MCRYLVERLLLQTEDVIGREFDINLLANIARVNRVFEHAVVKAYVVLGRAVRCLRRAIHAAVQSRQTVQILSDKLRPRVRNALAVDPTERVAAFGVLHGARVKPP